MCRWLTVVRLRLALILSLTRLLLPPRMRPLTLALVGNLTQTLMLGLSPFFSPGLTFEDLPGLMLG